MNIHTTHRSTNQCKRTSVKPSVTPKNARKEIRCLVALVISLYMYMTYMQVLFLVHTVLADVYSLRLKRSGAVRSPPLETSAREIALLLSLMLEARARFFFFIISFSRITPVLQVSLCPSSPGRPGLTVLFRAFLWPSSEAATITLLLFCKSFLI